MHGPETASVGSFSQRRGWARPALLALLGCIAALTLWGPARASAALPPQGVYEQCAPASDDCGPRLQAIADAGFQYVLNYTAWYGSAEQVRNYADEAQAVGLKVIWPLNDHAWRDGTNLRSYYRYLGPDCPCSTNAEFKQWALGLVKDHPATWGFYVGDELSPTPQNISQTQGAGERGEVDRARQAHPLHDDPQRQRRPHHPARAVRADRRLRGRRLLPRRQGRAASTPSPATRPRPASWPRSTGASPSSSSRPSPGPSTTRHTLTGSPPVPRCRRCATRRFRTATPR